MGKCQIFFAKKDENGFPIPETMQGYDRNPCSEGLIQIPSVTPVTPTGYHVCRNPKKWRYFVQVDTNGHIIPNSLKSFKGRPAGRCNVEFLKFVPNP